MLDSMNRQPLGIDGKSKNQVLIIDDEEPLCRALALHITRLGMVADCAHTLSAGLQHARSTAYDVIFLDVSLPDGCGLDIISQLRDSRLPPEIIIITGFGDEAAAETAIENQAWDYIQKGASIKAVILSLTRAIEYREQKKIKVRPIVLKRDTIVGNSPRLIACLESVSLAAINDSPVLITGETGTGKELFAKAIHANSARFSGDFVIVDCAALPEHLVESTLFGHKKGAFTGADRDYTGLIEQADRGTLFLDEIGELDLGIQKKFLRVLQEKRFRPVGSKNEIASDFRLICATHRNIPDMVEKNLFRPDLYFRIKSLPIALPPLRTRTEDIPPLVHHHRDRNCHLGGDRSHSMSPEFMEALQAYDWPGNVRELFNTIENIHSRALDEPMLFPKHLPVHIRAQGFRHQLKQADIDRPTDTLPQNAYLKPMKTFLDEMRCQYITELMNITRRDIAAACRISQLSRGHIYELLKKYGRR